MITQYAKRLRWLVCAAALGLVLSLSGGCSQQLAAWLLSEEQQPASVSSEALALLTLSGQRFALTALEAAVAEAQRESPKAQRLVFLLHGMGPYPEKAYQREELQAVSSTYQAAVLLLHWPSWRAESWLVLPRQTALASGRALQPLWPALDALKAQGALAGLQTGLIAHSMGAEVLRGVSQRPQRRVLDFVLLAAPESDGQTHASCLSALALASHTWVMINADDNMLPFAQALMGAERLGLSLPRDRVAAVEYWYFANVSDWHGLYASRQPPALTRWLQAKLSAKSDPPLPCEGLPARARVELFFAENSRLLCPD